VQGSTLNEGYAQLIADAGTRVKTARDLAEVSGRMRLEAQSRRENLSGVNLDEEAANLLRHQQSYQACAKIIQTSQSLFETLLAATGR
jgi:flagellar hook-associated protein 1